MKTFILDTNVVLRFLLADDPKHSPRAKQLFELAESGAVRLYLSHVVLAELVWTLASFFKFSRHQIGATLRGLVLHDGIEMDDQQVALIALEHFAHVNADYPDCYIAALALAREQPVASYDRDFRKFEAIQWQTPDGILKSK